MQSNQNSSEQNDLSSIFGEVISKYTRSMALDDGQLVDVTDVAREAGFRFPCALTAALWQVINTIPSRCPWEDVQGRLWDCLCMARQQAGKSKEGVSRFVFELILPPGGRSLEIYPVGDGLRSGRRWRAGFDGGVCGGFLR